MSSNNINFTKDNIDIFLKELGKEYRKLNKNGQRAELIIVGGISAIINYNFRQATTDIDALFHTDWTFKDAISNVRKKYELPDGWLNSDFKYTNSYSDKLVEHSKFYKSFYSLDVRTVNGEYAIAMKLISDRNYKSDDSDIIGIIKDERSKGNDITFEKIDKAMMELYNGWDKVSEKRIVFLKEVLNCKDLDLIYRNKVEEELINKDCLQKAKENYGNIVTNDNADSFIDFFKKNKLDDVEDINNNNIKTEKIYKDDMELDDDNFEL